MDFSKRMLPTDLQYSFCNEGYFVWCGTMLKFENFYYLIYSRWDKKYGFSGWVSHSQICLAKSDSIWGKFEFVKIIHGENEFKNGQTVVYHNPTVITYQNKFYLFYMTNYGNGEFWNHRNNQRIAVSFTENPENEWQKGGIVIDTSNEGIDSLMVSNPTAVVTPEGDILLLYKAVSKYGKMPIGGDVICGVAKAATPLGKFQKYGKPIMQNPKNPWSVEDPYIWYEDGKYYALVKDFHGYFTQTNECAIALFESPNGYDWNISVPALAFETILDLGTEKRRVHFLERPQIFFENGTPKCLLCACMIKENDENTFNIRIPLIKQ